MRVLFSVRKHIIYTMQAPVPKFFISKLNTNQRVSIHNIPNLLTIFFSLIAFYDGFFNTFTRIGHDLHRTIDFNASFSGYWKTSLRENKFQLQYRTFYLDISNIFQYNWNFCFQIKKNNNNKCHYITIIVSFSKNI